MSGSEGSFPGTYAHLDTDVLLDAYRRGPERVERAVGDLSTAALRARPVPAKWSILAIVLHMADSELMGAARIRLVLGADDPLLPAYDQDRWSEAMAYEGAAEERLPGALELFAGLRATTLPLLRDAGPDRWARSGVHPEHGPVTLRNLLELYADHSERHLEQILERRRLLGSPLDLETLLPERLY